MRIVISGAAGQVGSMLSRQAAAQGRDVLALTSAQWDISDPEAAGQIVRSGDVVINCAAYTNVDGAESDEERAYAVNAAGPEHIAQACARVAARMVHISTDYVFNGEASRPYDIDDDPAPLSVYGRSKLAGEQAVLAASPEAVVVRTAWVYTGSPTGKDFVATMRKLAAGDRVIEVVDDQVGSPTYTGDLVTALLQVADGHVHAPLVHAANGGEVSRFGQARAVFEGVGADPERVVPVSSARNPRPAARPAYSALSSESSASAGLTPLRPWQDALSAALRA
jgi:dTDP-4-dehydrorhamnose reductase